MGQATFAEIYCCCTGHTGRRKDSLRNKFFKGKNGIFIENTNNKPENVMFSLDIRAEKEIYTALRNLDEEGVTKRIDEVFEMINSSRLEENRRK